MSITIEEYKNHLIKNLNKISKFSKYYSYREDLSIVKKSLGGEDNIATYYYNKFRKYSARDSISITQQLKYVKYILKSQLFLNLDNNLIRDIEYSGTMRYILFPDKCIPKLLKFLDSNESKKLSKIKLNVLYTYSDICVIKDEYLDTEHKYTDVEKAKLEITTSCEYINFKIEIPYTEEIFTCLPYKYTIEKVRKISVTGLKSEVVPNLYDMLKIHNEINSVFNKHIKKEDISVATPYTSSLTSNIYIAKLMYNCKSIPIKEIESYLNNLIKGVELYPTFLKVDINNSNENISLYLSNNPDELEKDIEYIKRYLKNRVKFNWENSNINSSKVHKDMQIHVGWNYIGMINKKVVLTVLNVAKQVLEDKIVQCVNEINN